MSTTPHLPLFVQPFIFIGFAGRLVQSCVCMYVCVVCVCALCVVVCVVVCVCYFIESVSQSQCTTITSFTEMRGVESVDLSFCLRFPHLGVDWFGWLVAGWTFSQTSPLVGRVT